MLFTFWHFILWFHWLIIVSGFKKQMYFEWFLHGTYGWSYESHLKIRDFFCLIWYNLSYGVSGNYWDVVGIASALASQWEGGGFKDGLGPFCVLTSCFPCVWVSSSWSNFLLFSTEWWDWLQRLVRLNRTNGTKDGRMDFWTLVTEAPTVVTHL